MQPKSIAELSDKLTSEQKGELETKIADVRSALATDNVARIKEAREALEQSFHKISEEIYRQGAPAGAPGADYGAGAQGGPEQGGGRSGDDTIEGEYKEM